MLLLLQSAMRKNRAAKLTMDWVVSSRILITMSWFAVVICSVPSSIAQYSLDPIPRDTWAQPFSLPDTNGHLHNLNEYKGRFVLLNFWSMNCPSCREELINLEVAYQELKEYNLVVIAVHAGGEPHLVKRYLEPMSLNYTVLLDLDLSMVGWGVPVLPTTYLIAPDSRLLYRASSPRAWGSSSMIETLRAVTREGKEG